MKLDNGQLSVLLTSIAVGMLDSAKKRRVDHLGGWNKAKIKQGMFKRTDEGVMELEDAEERLFEALDKTLRKLNRTTERVASRGLAPNDIYALAGKVLDEQTRMINCYLDGKFNHISYKDGYRDAVEDIEELMFSKRMTRQAAVDAMKEAATPPKPLSPEGNN